MLTNQDMAPPTENVAVETLPPENNTSHITNTLLSFLRGGDNESEDGDEPGGTESMGSAQDIELNRERVDPNPRQALSTPSIPSSIRKELFRCLRFLCVGVYVTLRLVISTIYFFLLGVMLGLVAGACLMHQSIFVARESNVLHQKYRREGLRITGKVERQWKDLHSTSDTDSWVEKAIVSYDYNGSKYHMELIPLDDKVKESIYETSIPISLLSDNPSSGIPEAAVDSLLWTLPWRIAAFIGGCAVASFWVGLLASLFIFMIDDTDDENYKMPKNDIIIAFIVGGIISNLAFLVGIHCHHKHRGHPILRFSEEVVNGNVFTFEDNDRHS